MKMAAKPWPGDELAIVERYLILQAYLKTKTGEKDWHGVSDAANDLREMESANPWLKAVHGEIKVTRTG